MSTSKRYIAQVVNGIVLVNKPQGLSSNAVLQRVKHLFKAKKAGHTGSLDPLATGMLPICFGEATKFCQYILDADKCYEATGLLGITTDTGDSMGQVISETSALSVSEHHLREILPSFLGEIQQVPPMYSALKHQGKPLYHYARQGISIERPARTLVISDLMLNAFENPSFDLTITCSKGTYIRSLVESIGDALQVGAHVTRLHRTYTAGFEGERMYTLDELINYSEPQLIETLLPMDRAVMHLPSCVISSDNLAVLRNGQQVIFPSTSIAPGLVRLYEVSGEFLGLGELLDSQRLVSKRLFAFESVHQVI